MAESQSWKTPENLEIHASTYYQIVPTHARAHLRRASLVRMG
jgi:hypothetical protein